MNTPCTTQLFAATPWLTDQAITLLEAYLADHPQARLLEIGSGGSTLWFARRTPHVVSIEHDERWFDRVRQQLRAERLHTVTYILKSTPHNTVLPYFAPELFDIILLDGHNRVACALEASRLVKPGGIVLLDDADRPEYQPIFEHFAAEPDAWELHTSIQEGPDAYGNPGPQSTVWWIKN